MKLADISIRRPVMMTMVIMSFVVIGLFSLSRLGIDITPDIDFPYVVVTIIYPGAGPGEMETQVAEPIEEEVSAIGGVKNVTSISQEGMALILIEFDLKTNVDFAAIDVKDKIDMISYDLPEDIQDPIIQKFDFSAMPIINLALSSPRALDQTYYIADKLVKSRLSRVRGLANVDLTGGLEREIQVNLSRRKLKAYNISPQVVTALIAAHNLNIPAGHIIQQDKEISVRMTGEFSSLEELGNIEIPYGQNGEKVKLNELGWIEDTFEEQRQRARFNGETSVGLELVKRTDANTVEVARSVYREVEKIRTELPDDMVLDVARDASQFIQDSVDDVFGNMIVGIILTTFILFLFLHSIPSTIIAAVAMPTSIISTFILIDFAGFTLNMMSLMALAISVGILVANSIVVLENIERYKQKGLSPTEASAKGTNEIAIAVAASTLTNIVVFTPMAFMSGIVGQFFKQFGLTVAFATLFSLLVSFTLTPMMASMRIRKGLYAVFGVVASVVIYWQLGLDALLLFFLGAVIAVIAHSFRLMGKFAHWWNNLYDDLFHQYKHSLAWALRHRALVLGNRYIPVYCQRGAAGIRFHRFGIFPRCRSG